MQILHESTVTTCRDGAWRFRVRQERPLFARVDGRWRWLAPCYALQYEPPVALGDWVTLERTASDWRRWV